MNCNTLFLRLSGPMQAWGTGSRFQLRRTDSYPSKSGVLGLLLCAKGVARQDAPSALPSLTPLLLGVRVDQGGTPAWDYHTAGAHVGMRMAKGGIKHEGNKADRPFETMLSRRQYLWDASFLAALQGPSGTIQECAEALDRPVWPVYLGRKCCVPSEPVLAGTGTFDSLTSALSSVPWRPTGAAGGRNCGGSTCTLEGFIEHPPGLPAPEDARLVYDVPRAFGYWDYGPRWVVRAEVTAPVGPPLCPPRARRTWKDPYGPGWDAAREDRLQFDAGLCVFCKAPAEVVHHIDYSDVRRETLRSLCQLCHEACTMIEYGTDMRQRRIDPQDPALRGEILARVRLLLRERRGNRRRELLEAGRALGVRALAGGKARGTKEDQ